MATSNETNGVTISCMTQKKLGEQQLHFETRKRRLH